jgi:aspartyl-tRNA(Asn)/glutamyl-tRNA(Gln) amidotransferase subunit A
MTESYLYSDATRLARLIRAGEVSCVEVMQEHLDRIQAVNPQINAIVSLADGAIEAAEAADAALAAGVEIGPLHGVPFTVKDSIDTSGVPTQRGSPIFGGRIPDTDATGVARIKGAGGILLAKTNLPEFSYSTETDNLLTGRTNNPWNLERTPGGSSGGESAAIASGMSPLGLGTDLAISVRGPAAHTGIASLKPTHGRIPMTGVWPRQPRRDWHLGPMAHSIRDLALAYSLLAGPDGHDSFSTTVPGYDRGVGTSPTRPIRVGWLVDSGLGPVDREVAETVRAAADALANLGAIVEPVTIAALEKDNPLDVFFRQLVMEVKPTFRAVTDGHEDQMFEISKDLMATPDTPVEAYVDAEQGYERLRDGFAEYFQKYDALLLPTTPIPAPPHAMAEYVIEGQTVNAGAHMMTFTVPFNITGLPALTMRFGSSQDGLPIAIQLAAPWHSESTVLHLASLLESVSTVRDLHPNI